jgi:hypothetical protein
MGRLLSITKKSRELRSPVKSGLAARVAGRLWPSTGLACLEGHAPTVERELRFCGRCGMVLDRRTHADDPRPSGAPLRRASDAVEVATEAEAAA